MRRLNLPAIRHRLLRWYDRNRRDLPWRRTRDPYAIWIAETMLQQTQVKTALPYYRRFLRAFPSLRLLDRAPLNQVLALWAGLGYYRRAESLKKAARKIAREYGGKIPQEFEKLQGLPGVGPYTAGALMSIAFTRPYPALDGNARRVLTRLLDVKRERDLFEIGRRLVSRTRPGHFNQALMELGSKICRSRDPSCPICPVASYCAARGSGQFVKRASKATHKLRKIDWPLLVIQNRGKILLRRRPREGILAGFWEVPGGERKNGKSLKTTLIRELNGLGGQLKLDRPIREIRHSITNRRIRAYLFLLVRPDKPMRLPHPGWRWVAPSALRRYPVSSLSLKALRLIPR